MIYDAHAYSFPDLSKDGGFADPAQFKRHLQIAMGRHFPACLAQEGPRSSRHQRIGRPQCPVEL